MKRGAHRPFGGVLHVAYSLLKLCDALFFLKNLKRDKKTDRGTETNIETQRGMRYKTFEWSHHPSLQDVEPKRLNIE